MKVFLYDYINDNSKPEDQESSIVLFGYTEQRQKCEVVLTGFEIYCDLAADFDFFNTEQGITATIQNLKVSQGKRDKESKDLILNITTVNDRRVFKGYSNSSSQIIRVSFKSFARYEQFKKSVDDFNKQVLLMQIGQVVDASKYARDCYVAFQAKHKQQSGETPLTRAPIRVLEDDPAQKYIYKLQRHHKFTMSGWNSISEYKLKCKSPRLRIEAALECISPDDQLTHVPLNILSWDIEVSTETGKFDSNGRNPKNRIVCICYTVADAVGAGQSHKQVCIISNDHDAEVIHGEQGECIQVIKTPTEQAMILKFAEQVYIEDPTFVTGFNDSAFDWPFLKQKIEYYGDPEFYAGRTTRENPKTKFLTQFTNALQGRQVDEYMGVITHGFAVYTKPGDLFKSSDVKITASNTRKGLCIDVPGIICIDTRTLLMKDQVLEKRSLNEYLKANNLPLKLEVSFDDMNRAFKTLVDEEDLDDDSLTLQESMQLCGLAPRTSSKSAMQTLNRIYEYCVYDADACRLLWCKRNLVFQQMEVCKLSFTPLRAGFMNANGIKVRNMVASFAHDRGFAVPMSSSSHDVRLRDKRLLDEYQKYPGAYVPEPHKGVSLTPVIALDFASLYPSIIMAHNLSPENVIEECDIQDVVDDYSELYSKVILKDGTERLCNKVTVDFEKDARRASIKAYVLAREEGVGVYPGILQDLFNKRAHVKKILEAIDDQIKELEHDKASNADKISDLLYQYSLVDAKQKAIKVFMNTFYGETGNQKSSLFDVVISGGTTSYGQKYIKQVHKTIGDRDCEVVAGDTDSIYFRPRASHYQFRGDYISCSDVLDQANQIADQMRIYVNTMVGKQTHGFLKMAFEELLCPSVFTGKKKYFGAMYKPGDAHRSAIDVAARGSVLVKGIDFIKSQYPDLVKRHGYQLINTILNQYNDMLKSGVTSEMFRDSNRSVISVQLLNICMNQSVKFLNEMKSLTPDKYGMLSSKKRMRAPKEQEEQKKGKSKKPVVHVELQPAPKKAASGGEMAGFRQRLTSRAMVASDDPLNIYTEDLQDMNIPIPMDGEVLEIVYIEPIVFMKNLKSAQRMHLLEWAQKKQIPLNFNEYLKLFSTSTVRISMAARLPSNIDELDAGSQQLQFKAVQKILKAEFNIDNITSEFRESIVKTPHEIHYTNDIQDIREFIDNAPTESAIARVVPKISTLTKLVKHAMKSPAQLQALKDAINDSLDQVSPWVNTLLLGSKKSQVLQQIALSNSDSRSSYIRHAFNANTIYPLLTIEQSEIEQFLLLRILQCMLSKEQFTTPPKNLLDLAH